MVLLCMMEKEYSAQLVFGGKLFDYPYAFIELMKHSSWIVISALR